MNDYTNMIEIFQRLVDKYDNVESITSIDEPGMEQWYDVKSPRLRNAFVINFTNGEKFIFNKNTFKELGDGSYEIRDISQWGAPYSLRFEI